MRRIPLSRPTDAFCLIRESLACLAYQNCDILEPARKNKLLSSYHCQLVCSEVVHPPIINQWDVLFYANELLRHVTTSQTLLVCLLPLALYFTLKSNRQKCRLDCSKSCSIFMVYFVHVLYVPPIDIKLNYSCTHSI